MTWKQTFQNLLLMFRTQSIVTFKHAVSFESEILVIYYIIKKMSKEEQSRNHGINCKLEQLPHEEVIVSVVVS